MTNILTDSSPVTDEELDQMIWKLERDGMTPKLLSLMREVREVRRANAEKLNQPVSETESLPLGYLQGHKDGQEWSAQMAEANHPQTGDWLYDDPAALAAAIRKGPDMPLASGNYPITPESWKEEAEKLAESYGAAFVIFRRGEEPVCADPTKFWFGFDPAAPYFRENENSSTKHFRENEETSTNSPSKCWCHTCRPVTMNDMRFVVCPDCGNKRCPHANDHKNACAGSNEPGQVGSAYPTAPREVKYER